MRASQALAPIGQKEKPAPVGQSRKTAEAIASKGAGFRSAQRNEEAAGSRRRPFIEVGSRIPRRRRGSCGWGGRKPL